MTTTFTAANTASPIPTLEVGDRTFDWFCRERIFLAAGFFETGTFTYWVPDAWLGKFPHDGWTVPATQVYLCLEAARTLRDAYVDGIARGAPYVTPEARAHVSTLIRLVDFLAVCGGFTTS